MAYSLTNICAKNYWNWTMNVKNYRWWLGGIVFTARRYASAVYAVVVCLCVCLSVTLRYCIKTAKRRITQIMPHDSPGNLVF